MDIITNSQLNSKYIHYSINIYDEDRSSFLDMELPIPNLHTHLKNGYSITYFINGFNGTNKTNDFYLDTQNRILTSLGNQKFKILETPIITDMTKKYFEKFYEFKDFLHLEKSKTQKFINSSKLVRTFDKDKIFEIVRFDAYEMKRLGTLTYENVLSQMNYYNDRLKLGKTFSDIRCKTKAIYEWTENYYNIGSGNTDRTEYQKEYYQLHRGEDTMKKSEQLEQIYNKKRMETQKKILETVKILKEQNKKITQKNISEISKIHKNTLLKYKEFINSIK